VAEATSEYPLRAEALCFSSCAPGGLSSGLTAGQKLVPALFMPQVSKPGKTHSYPRCIRLSKTNEARVGRSREKEWKERRHFIEWIYRWMDGWMDG
jgi:hypothetical protein